MHSSASAKSVLWHQFYNSEMNKGHYVYKVKAFAVPSKSEIKQCCYCNAQFNFRFSVLQPDHSLKSWTEHGIEIHFYEGTASVSMQC